MLVEKARKGGDPADIGPSFMHPLPLPVTLPLHPINITSKAHLMLVEKAKKCGYPGDTYPSHVYPLSLALPLHPPKPHKKPNRCCGEEGKAIRRSRRYCSFLHSSTVISPSQTPIKCPMDVGEEVKARKRSRRYYSFLHTSTVISASQTPIK
jgi:hypothetical protein